MADKTSTYYIGKMPVGGCITPAVSIWNKGIPLKADTYKSCSNLCHYCFARNMSAGMVERSGVRYNPRIARHYNINDLTRHFNDSQRKPPSTWTGWAIKNHYYIELGTMCEVFQDEDATMKYTWNFLSLCRSFEVPLFINTKANLLVRNENYFRTVADHTAPVILSMTIITNNDNDARNLEPFSPLASERIQLIKDMRREGIPTVVYCGPFMKGITDKDLESYMGSIIEAGAVGLHLRDFYLTGKLLKTRRWKSFLEENAQYIVPHGYGHRMSRPFMVEIYNRMQEIANKLEPRFQIVGFKTNWFDLNPHHGKISYDYLPKQFQLPLVDFTAMPILRKVRERASEPQLLTWSNLGYEAEKIEHPKSLSVAGTEEGGYLGAGCFHCFRSFSPVGNATMDGYEWIKRGLWNGFEDKPSGFISTMKRIHPVVDASGSYAKEGDDYIFVYLPDEAKQQYLSDGKAKVSQVTDLHKPKRSKGTEDKYFTQANIFEGFDKWKPQ